MRFSSETFALHATCGLVIECRMNHAEWTCNGTCRDIHTPVDRMPCCSKSAILCHDALFTYHGIDMPGEVTSIQCPACDKTIMLQLTEDSSKHMHVVCTH